MIIEYPRDELGEVTVARIRSLKPEAFVSESLSHVSVEAERTFLGLSTYADDRGRLRDQPAVINGALWPMRAAHTPANLDAELGELEREGLLCRYVGCDGRRYAHLVTWDEHQKIDRPSRSRQPRCPRHAHDDYCGRHDGDCPAPTMPAPEPPSMHPREPSRAMREPSMLDLGPRTVDLGPKNGERASARDEPPPDVETEPGPVERLIAWHADNSPGKVPRKVRDQLGTELAQLVADGFTEPVLRQGLALMRRKRVGPALLASLVDAIVNAPPPGNVVALHGGARASPATRPSTADARFQAGLDLAARLERGSP